MHSQPCHAAQKLDILLFTTHSGAGTHSRCGGPSTVGVSDHRFHTGTPSEVPLIMDGRFPACTGLDGPQPTPIPTKSIFSHDSVLTPLCKDFLPSSPSGLAIITHFSLYRLESILTSLYLLLRAFNVTGSWEAEVLVGFLER